MKLPQANHHPYRLKLLIATGVIVVALVGVTIYMQHRAYAPLGHHEQEVAKKTDDKKELALIVEQIPVRMVIQKIEVDAPIHSVGLDASGAMDVPNSNTEIGWYNRSAQMGQTARSILLDGHYGTDDEPAVFYRLSELKVGDSIMLVGDKQTQATYTVTETSSQPLEQVDMKKALYYGEGKETLTIITCEGKYDAARATYNDRQVVYAVRSQ